MREEKREMKIQKNNNCKMELKRILLKLSALRPGLFAA